VIAGHQLNAVGFQRIERIGDFGQRVVHIRHRYRRKMSEPVGMRLAQALGVLVDGARQFLGRLAITAMNARRRQRQHRMGDAVLVHLLECGLK
jgi:hypothetical protein